MFCNAEFSDNSDPYFTFSLPLYRFLKRMFYKLLLFIFACLFLQSLKKTSPHPLFLTCVNESWKVPITCGLWPFLCTQDWKSGNGRGRAGPNRDCEAQYENMLPPSPSCAGHQSFQNWQALRCIWSYLWWHLLNPQLALRVGEAQSRNNCARPFCLTIGVNSGSTEPLQSARTNETTMVAWSWTGCGWVNNALQCVLSGCFPNFFPKQKQ